MFGSHSLTSGDDHPVIFGEVIHGNRNLREPSMWIPVSWKHKRSKIKTGEVEGKREP